MLTRGKYLSWSCHVSYCPVITATGSLGQAVLLLTHSASQESRFHYFHYPCAQIPSRSNMKAESFVFALAVKEYSLLWERRQSSWSGAVKGTDSCNGAYLHLGGSGNGARTRNRALHCGQCLLARQYFPKVPQVFRRCHQLGKKCSNICLWRHFRAIL